MNEQNYEVVFTVPDQAQGSTISLSSQVVAYNSGIKEFKTYEDAVEYINALCKFGFFKSGIMISKIFRTKKTEGAGK